MTPTDHNEYERKVAEMRHLLGIEGNVLAYTETFPSFDELGEPMHMRYESTFDPTGTAVITTELIGMADKPEDER